MSFQGALEEFIDNMKEEEAKEALTDIVLLLSNLSRDDEETKKMLIKIYNNRFGELKE